MNGPWRSSAGRGSLKEGSSSTRWREEDTQAVFGRECALLCSGGPIANWTPPEAIYIVAAATSTGWHRSEAEGFAKVLAERLGMEDGVVSAVCVPAEEEETVVANLANLVPPDVVFAGSAESLSTELNISNMVGQPEGTLVVADSENAVK